MTVEQYPPILGAARASRCGSAAVVVARRGKTPLLASPPCGGARFPTLAAHFSELLAHFSELLAHRAVFDCSLPLAAMFARLPPSSSTQQLRSASLLAGRCGNSVTYGVVQQRSLMIPADSAMCVIPSCGLPLCHLDGKPPETRQRSRRPFPSRYRNNSADCVDDSLQMLAAHPLQT
jgi:hypothetical protein